MASLQFSCSLFCTSTPHRQKSSSSKPFSAKPSSTHDERSRTFHVSCNGDQKPSTRGGVDRRNMLLGMGGLYGAANLISDPKRASADPLQPPDFTKCGAAHDTGSNDLLDVNCCPPMTTDDIIDYKVPLIPTRKIRPAGHRVTEKYVKDFNEAIRLMKKLDVDDPLDPRGFRQQANIHCAYCNGPHDQPGTNIDIQIHNTWLFFPFHRWYLYFFEKIMGEMINDPTFTLPFWNWDNPRGMKMPKMFDDTTSFIYDCNRNQAHRPPALIDLTFSGATEDPQLIANNLSEMHSEFIRSVNSTLDFMGSEYKANDLPNQGSAGTLERGSHVAAHWWVGDPRNKYNEDMGNFYSAGRDTIFYCHHANVDRMWTIWRDLKTDVPKDIQNPDYLDAAFLFYDEKKRLVRVKVRDCVDNKRMGYEYEKVDIPWINYRPPKKTAKANIQDAETADKLFPLTLNQVTRVLVQKSARGNVDEVLVLENIVTDPTKFVKFDVFINDEDDNPTELDRAEYAGSYAQVPHKTSKSGKNNGSITLKLTDIYKDILIADDDTVVVSLIPRANGEDVTIGGIKIIPSPPRAA